MKKRLLLTMLAAPLLAGGAHADEGNAWPPIKVSGFGTAALTASDAKNAEFSRPNQYSGVQGEPRFGVDSNLGLQAVTNVNDWLSATVQVLMRKDGADTYGAELAWAFAKAKLSDNVSVRVGRVGLPVFMISDYRNVGYANTLLRPPVEVYSQVPFGSLDGADITYQQSFGDTTYTAQLAAGGAKTEIVAAAGSLVHLESKSATAINLVAEHGPLTVRFGRLDTKLSQDDFAGFNTLAAALRSVGSAAKLPQLNAWADAAEVKDKKASFTSVGLGLDWNNIVLQSEYAKRKTDTFIADTTSWYLMGGYRIGKFLPYYSHGNLAVNADLSNPVPAAPALAPLRAGVGQFVAPVEQSSDTIGVRWDFYRSAALKVQIDRIKPKAGGGLLTNKAPNFNASSVMVGAVAIDFVF